MLTLHGLKDVAGDTGGGHYGQPQENDPRIKYVCQAQLMLVSAKIFKFNSQSINSEMNGAELMLLSQPPTYHPP